MSLLLMVIKCARKYALVSLQCVPWKKILENGMFYKELTVFVFNGTTEWKQKDYYSQMVIYTSLEEIWYNENNRNLSFMAFDSHKTTCVNISVCIDVRRWYFCLKTSNNLYKTYCFSSAMSSINKIGYLHIIPIKFTVIKALKL